jgi:hypothetical protein
MQRNARFAVGSPLDLTLRFQEESVLNVPGFGKTIDHGGPSGSRLPHGADAWSSSALTLRDLTMMEIMDQLTDKEEWDRKVFDENIVSKWRAPKPLPAM